MFKLESAKEMLNNAESSIESKDWIEANHWLTNYLCARLNKIYPIDDLDGRYDILSVRLHAEMDLGVWLDVAEEAMDSKDMFAAENALITFADFCRGSTPGLDVTSLAAGATFTPSPKKTTKDQLDRYQALDDRFYELTREEVDEIRQGK